MNIKELILKVDRLKTNAIAYTDKLDWVMELAAQVKTEVWDTHEGEPEEDPLFHIWKIDDREEALTELSEIDIPDAFIKFYEYYLYAKIDLENADYDRYDNSLVLFNEAYAKYKRWYHRNHMPKGRS